MASWESRLIQGISCLSCWAHDGPQLAPSQTDSVDLYMASITGGESRRRAGHPAHRRGTPPERGCPDMGPPRALPSLRWVNRESEASRTGRGSESPICRDRSAIVFDKRPSVFYPSTTCEKRIPIGFTMNAPGIIAEDFWLVFLQVRWSWPMGKKTKGDKA